MLARDFMYRTHFTVPTSPGNSFGNKTYRFTGLACITTDVCLHWQLIQ